MAKGRGQYKKFEIKHCRSCSSEKLQLILDLGPLYLSDFIKSQNKRPKKYPLTLVVCLKCNLVQLKHTTPPKELYTERYGYKSGVNNTMKNELREIVGNALKISKAKKGDLVIDIGTNDGTLLSFYPKSVKRVGVEPVKKLALEAKRHADLMVNDYFSAKLIKNHLRSKKAKVITAIAMFYDIDDPNKFLEDVRELIDNDGIFIIQQNYLAGMLKLNAFDNVVHEHLEYYSLNSLEKLLLRNGLRVFDVEEGEINGGSFRTYICLKNSPFKESPRVKKMRETEKRLRLNDIKTYDNFAKRVQKNKKNLRKYIENEAKKGKKTYVYGASTRGNTILQFYELDNKLIPAAIERNPQKWGKYIASVGIPIISEKQARKDAPDNMLVLPWFFKKEFIRREKDYLKRGGCFIFPLPEFAVVKSSKKKT